MLNGLNMSQFSLKYLARWTKSAFKYAAEHIIDDVEPLFNEAAGSGSGDGAGPLAKGNFQSALISKVMGNSMADNTSNRVLRMSKAQSAMFTKQNLQSVHIT